MERPADPALSELLSRMHWVRGLARALVQDVDRADDLSQEAWSRALRGGPARSEAWRGWFARVMKNRVADERRRQGQHARFTARQPRESGGPTEEEIRQQMETHEALSEAIRALPDPYRRAVFLHYFEGWSLARIAAEDGCDKRAIEKRLRQARGLLRSHLERRAPAEHWAAGLLLLAPAPQKAATLAVAAALLAVALIVPAAWLLRPATKGVAPKSEAAATLAGAPSPADGAQPAPAQMDLPAMTREEVESTGAAAPSTAFELIFVIQDADTKAGIPNVRVTANCRDAAQRGLETNQGITDTQGRLALRFTAASAEALVSIVPEDWAYESAPAVSFGWGSYRESIEFTHPLKPFKGIIRGVVRDESGAPVPGAFVDLFLDGDELKSPHPDITVQAGLDGNFEVTPLRPDRSYVVVAPRAAGMYATRGFEVNRDLPEATRVEGVELTLSPGRPFSVEVIDERRQPIVGARVVIWPGRGTDNFEARSDGEYRGRHNFSRITDATGKIAAVMIGNEPWQVNVSHDAFAKRETARVPEGEGMLVILENGRSVRGILHGEDGLPAPNVEVIVEGPSGNERTRSDDQGAFLTRAPGLAGQEVRILCIPNKPFAYQVVGPFVPEDLKEPLVITLSLGSNLNFRLVYADGAPFDRMQGVEWDVLSGPTARAPGGDANSARSWLKLRPEGDHGGFSDVGFVENTFHFFQCPAGTYRFRLSNADGILAEADVTAGVKGQQIVLPGEPTAHGVFHGRVLRAGSQDALTSFDVIGYRFAGQEERIPVNGWGISEIFQNPEGRFRFEHLITGWWEFEIQATPDLTDWRSGRIWIEPDSEPLTVVLDEVMAGALTILYPDGTPATRCQVSFVDERNERMWFARAPDAGTRLDDCTDDLGRLRVAQLPRSLPFQIWVTPQSGPTRVVPAGALNPALTEWRITLPD